ncbi:MAG: DeoR/GlpR family DNA-binding transcription regulator [Treponema sp.]|nr:DeoR/GlpR family DNA-binding transcription regulator [Treponema sp.]MCL2238028.1 DeoR/GlpR family DNA-binding transcription regulator [Treponema sp.]
MRLFDRTVMILDVLASQKTIKNAVLMETLNISHVTLRKDLEELEKRGIVRCAHGVVSLDEANNTGKRMAFNYLLKRKIAKIAADTIDSGETVMVGSGSCCALLVEELAFAKRSVTIITNSTYIVNFIRDFSNNKIIFLGGYFQPCSQVAIGPMTINCAQQFHSDKYFLGTDGFDMDKGFTGRDQLQVETALGLAKCANNVFVLTESVKFKQQGTCALIQLDKITGVYTDDGIPKEAEAALLKNNVELFKVSIADELSKWKK